MSVDFNRFCRWAEDRFGDDAKVVGREVCINSIFEPGDTGQHLWCNPDGGKKGVKHGVFHCWKSGRKGSLLKLVQIVDNCDREDALATLQGQLTVRELEARLEEFFNEPPPAPPVAVERPALDLPAGASLISDLPANNWWRRKAEAYLGGRKIPAEGFYVCTEKPYKFRILIPYYDRRGKLIYWNTRAMGDSKLRYQGPPKACGVGKGDVVYVPGPWPEPGSLVHLCEGEFNAIALKIAELDAAACGGKNMCDKQALMLRDYRICLCLDRDKAGKAGMGVMSNAVGLFDSLGSRDRLSYVRPAVGYKDWNQMLVALGPSIVHHYIKINAKPVDFNAPAGMAGDIFLL